MCKVSVFVVLLLCVTINVVKCKRYRGGGGRIPSHRTSPPTYHPPAYHPPAQHPPSHGSGSGTVRPLGFDPPSNNHNNHPPPHQVATSRPLGFEPPPKPSAPIEPPKYNAPVQNAPHGTGHNPPPYNPQYNPAGYGPPPPYTPHNNPAGYGPPPPYTPHNNPGGYGPPPPYSPAGYGQHPLPGGYYNPQGGYHPQGGGNTIINNNINNHYSGSGGGYGGYSAPVYTSHDTGSTALGFFLGYSLAKITTPSLYYSNSYGNGPTYDHYTVHHYYHNKESVPAVATVETNAIVACIGDSGSFCPANTTSLCTNNGAVMCVASALSTVPCSKEKQTNCIKSSVPCKDNNAPECKGSSQNAATITIPCISTAKIYGSINYVNNSIVISNDTINSSTSTTTTANSNTRVDGSNIAVTTTEANTNITTTEANTNITTTETNTNVTTTQSVGVNTTLAIPTSTQITANTTDDKKAPQMFCVTVLALPAARKLSEGEKLINHSKDVFSKFAVKALGIE